MAYTVFNIMYSGGKYVENEGHVDGWVGVYRCFAYNDSICTTWVCGVMTMRFCGTDCLRIVIGGVVYV